MNLPAIPVATRSPPAEFDGFRVVRPLGRGGMGTVFLGHDTLLDRAVALKFIDAENPDPAARSRFLVESRALARLSHPNVVSVYRSGEVEGRPYLAYEFVSGTSLDRVALPLQPEEVLAIGVSVARGLAAAHRRGVIHRDVKPGNIMRADSGEVKLLDFGLAKLVDRPHAAPPPGTEYALERGDLASLRSQPISHTGLIGTPIYLAPELWTGAPATPRGDIYALGAVLFHLAAGRFPADWEALDLMTLLGVVERGLPPVRSMAPGLSPAFAAMIDRCVRPSPLERFETADAVRDALEALDRPGQAGVGFPTARSGVDLATARTVQIPVGFAPPETRYAVSGKVSLAYQTLGEGPIDLVMLPGFVSNVEVSWEEPSFARFLRRLASFSRLIVFDKRGTGLSDRVTDAASLEERMDDIRAVMDAAGSERAVIFGMSEGALMCVLFATTYPERTRAAVLYGCTPRSKPAPDFPWGLSEETWNWAYEEVRRSWGGPTFIELEAPSRMHDEAFRAWWSRYLKMSASPGATVALLKMNSEIDVRALLPAVRVPTLVAQRRGDRLMRFEGAQYMAEHIPGATFLPLEGDDHIPFLGDADALLDAIEAFVRGAHAAPGVARVLSTTIAVVGRGLRASLGDATRRELVRFRGLEAGGIDEDRVIATFDGPVRAVRCAHALVTAAREARAGVHSAEADLTQSEQQGTALAMETAACAMPGSVLVTEATKNLLAGSGLTLEAAGGQLSRVTGLSP